MKTFSEIQKSLSREKPKLYDQYRVNRVGVFGSYVRGDQRPDSDLDVLVNYEETPNLIRLIELEFYLTEITGIKVDLVTEKGLKPQLRNRIINEVVYV